MDEMGGLGQPLPCVRCGYNLIGVPVRGQCPECRTAVKVSLRGSLLAAATPWWLTRMARAMALLPVWLFASLGAWIAEPTLIEAAPQQASFIWWLPHGVGLLAVWWLTTPDPGHAMRKRGARWLARLTLSAALTLGVLRAALVALAMPEAVLMGVRLGAIVLGTAGLFALFEWVRTLAHRVPDRGLARQTRVAMVLALVTWYVTVPARIASAGLALMGVDETLRLTPDRLLVVFALIGLCATWLVMLCLIYWQKVTAIAKAAQAVSAEA